MSDLSELEACVLGLIWSEAPCTPYRIQQIVKQSPSPHWSGSAGAIYPIFQRLQTRGLVSSQSRRQGKRPSRVFSISTDGRKALRGWIGLPLPTWAVDLPIDPLRTRLRFLGALPAARRLPLLREAKAQLLKKLLEISADCQRLKELDDPFPHAMARGAHFMMEARIQWLAEVEQTIS